MSKCLSDFPRSFTQTTLQAADIKTSTTTTLMIVSLFHASCIFINHKSIIEDALTARELKIQVLIHKYKLFLQYHGLCYCD